jgi:hypothetical protein
MNKLAALIPAYKPGTIFPPLDDNGPLGQFRAWERGFEAFLSGRGHGSNCEHGRARPLWRNGWAAAQRIEELRHEQQNQTSHL